MTARAINVPMLCVIALTACGSAEKQAPAKHVGNAAVVAVSDRRQGPATAGAASRNSNAIPTTYLKAFTCDFDENPIAAWERYHKTSAGRAARAGDLKLLRSLGFDRTSRDGDLDSLGGKITAPPGLSILGLPVRSLELNGMLGDANSMYVTTFAKGVTVGQVVKAARLELDYDDYKKYKMRHYSRHISSEPVTELTLDDEGDGAVELVCQVQGTPD